MDNVTTDAVPLVIPPGFTAPLPGVTYPLKPVYCAMCDLPKDFCSFGPNKKKCPHAKSASPVDETNIDDANVASVEKLSISNNDANDVGNDKTSTESSETNRVEKSKNADDANDSARAAKAARKKINGAPKVRISKQQRTKRKCITIISGLDLFGINLKEAAKLFSKKFACSSSVVQDPSGLYELQIQGDVEFDIVDFIEETWEQIPEDDIIVKSK